MIDFGYGQDGLTPLLGQIRPTLQCDWMKQLSLAQIAFLGLGIGLRIGLGIGIWLGLGIGLRLGIES